MLELQVHDPYRPDVDRPEKTKETTYLLTPSNGNTFGSVNIMPGPTRHDIAMGYKLGSFTKDTRHYWPEHNRATRLDLVKFGKSLDLNHEPVIVPSFMKFFHHSIPPMVKLDLDWKDTCTAFSYNLARYYYKLSTDLLLRPKARIGYTFVHAHATSDFGKVFANAALTTFKKPECQEVEDALDLKGQYPNGWHPGQRYERMAAKAFYNYQLVKYCLWAYDLKLLKAKPYVDTAFMSIYIFENQGLANPQDALMKKEFIDTVFKTFEVPTLPTHLIV